MGLYLRKYFRAGPVRLNLSKGGLGLSGGITGSRLGVGPKGTYLHGGRYGLYYRKHLSPGQRTRNQPAFEDNKVRFPLLICVAIGLLFLVLLEKYTVIFFVFIIAIVYWVVLFRRQKIIMAYKQSLDSAFVTNQLPASDTILISLEQQQEELPKNDKSKRVIDKIEADVYQAILDKVLDDGFITKEEAEIIAAAEKTLRISETERLTIKKEIFSAAYIEVIRDREITEEEFNKLNNLIEGLAIPEAEVRQELNIVKEIIDAQSLRLPFDPIPSDKLLVPINKNEVVFYQKATQVLSKRKSKKSSKGYEYTVRRSGTMVITNKRIFIEGNGTTNLRFPDIDDLEVDIDEGVIEIAKIGSGRPTVLKADGPIYTGRVIDLLVKAAREDKAI